MKGSSDGVWKEIQYFISQPGKGVFVLLAHLKPDTRFGSDSNNAVVPPGCTYVNLYPYVVHIFDSYEMIYSILVSLSMVVVNSRD